MEQVDAETTLTTTSFTEPLVTSVPAVQITRTTTGPPANFVSDLFRNTSNSFFNVVNELVQSPRLSASLIIDVLSKDFRYMYIALLAISVILLGNIASSFDL
jgi:hypothetical protein